MKIEVTKEVSVTTEVAIGIDDIAKVMVEAALAIGEASTKRHLLALANDSLTVLRAIGTQRVAEIIGMDLIGQIKGYIAGTVAQYEAIENTKGNPSTTAHTAKPRSTPRCPRCGAATP